MTSVEKVLLQLLQIVVSAVVSTDKVNALDAMVALYKGFGSHVPGAGNLSSYANYEAKEFLASLLNATNRTSQFSDKWTAEERSVFDLSKKTLHAGKKYIEVLAEKLDWYA